MPRPATGQILEPDEARRSWSLRVRAYGGRHHIRLGRPEDGWTRKRAEAELAIVLAQIELGRWHPPSPRRQEPIVENPTFHEFSSEWLAARSSGLRPATQVAYRNELVHHLLPFFHAHRLTDITVAEVDRYREQKVTEADRGRRALATWRLRCEHLKPGQPCPPRPPRVAMSASYINGTITRLGAILDVADERGLIDRNPVRVNPRNRKVKATRTRSAFLDHPDQIEALLVAAGELDAESAKHVRGDGQLRRPLLATLIFSGLRIGEALALRWRDVDFAGGRLRVSGAVSDAKTDAGVRWVPMMPLLRDELLARKAATRFGKPGDLVFASNVGRVLSRQNVMTRVLRKSQSRADEALEHAGLTPLPERLTLHSLRHTYISCVSRWETIRRRSLTTPATLIWASRSGSTPT